MLLEPFRGEPPDPRERWRAANTSVLSSTDVVSGAEFSADVCEGASTAGECASMSVSAGVLASGGTGY